MTTSLSAGVMKKHPLYSLQWLALRKASAIQTLPKQTPGYDAVLRIVESCQTVRPTHTTVEQGC